MLGVMLFHLCCILGLCSVNGFVYGWFMCGLFLVYFGLGWIGFNSWFTGLAYPKFVLR